MGIDQRNFLNEPTAEPTASGTLSGALQGRRAQGLRRRTYRGTHMRDSRGVYSWKSETFVSITTLLKVLDKPALPRWASKSVAEYVAGFVREVVPRDRLKWSQVQAHLSDTEHLKDVPWKYAETRRNLGSSLHDVAEQFIAGSHIDTAVFSDDLRPLVENYLDFCKAERPEFYAMETAVFNRTLGYACTLDAIVTLPRLGNVLCVMDNKTGKDIYPEAIIQVNAQRVAEFVGLADGSEIEMPKCAKNLVLLVQENGWKLAECPILKGIKPIIKALKILYEYNEKKQKVQFVAEQEEF